MCIRDSSETVVTIRITGLHILEYFYANESLFCKKDYLSTYVCHMLYDCGKNNPVVTLDYFVVPYIIIEYYFFVSNSLSSWRSPVSYTHLDVYKRQTLISILISFTINKNTRRLYINFPVYNHPTHNIVTNE